MLVRKIINIYEPLTEEEKAQMEIVKNIKDADIDYSDIPEITPEQARQFKRVNPKRKAAN